MKRIGIEKALSHVGSFLEERQMNVEVLDEKNKELQNSLNRFDAIVVTGADANLMGMEDTMTKTPIIDAGGKTAEEVYDELMRRIK